MILGKLGEFDQSHDISNFDIKSWNFREQGWIIIEGLIGLGNGWILQNLDDLLKCFQATFGKKICNLEPQRLSEEPIYLEFFVREFKTKGKALNSLLRVLRNESIGKKVVQCFSAYLGNATTFLLLKDTKLLWAAINTNEVIPIHTTLFQCLKLVPPNYYKSKLVPLLHSLCDAIIT